MGLSRIGGTALALAIVGAATLGSGSTAPAIADEVNEYVALPFDADCNGCYTCTSLACLFGHKAVADPEGTVKGPAESTCHCLADDPDDCEGHGHTTNSECDGGGGGGGPILPGDSLSTPEVIRSAAELAKFFDAVRGADGRQIARVLDDYGKAVELNIERRALQPIGCGGRLLAHIPLTGTQWTQLNDEFAEAASADSR
jgi:hypothetical protein